MAQVFAICISEKRGIQKHPVDAVVLKEHHGIVGDAHADNWHRQISILDKKDIDDFITNDKEWILTATFFSLGRKRNIDDFLL